MGQEIRTLLIPIKPALAPTISSTKSGEVAVNPKRVVLRYFYPKSKKQLSVATNYKT